MDRLLLSAGLTVLTACASACTLRAGGRSTSLPGEGTAVVTVRPKGRNLRVTLTESGRVLTLSRPVRRSSALRRLRLWAVASEPCPLSATARGSGRVLAAAGPDSPARLDLRLAKPARRVLLEAVAGTEPSRTATLTLRR